MRNWTLAIVLLAACGTPTMEVCDTRSVGTERFPRYETVCYEVEVPKP